jgi:hypothetical protein
MRAFPTKCEKFGLRSDTSAIADREYAVKALQQVLELQLPRHLNISLLDVHLLPGQS